MTSLFTEPRLRLVSDSRRNHYCLTPTISQRIAASELLRTSDLPNFTNTRTEVTLNNAEFIAWMKNIFQERVHIASNLGNDSLKRKIKSQLGMLDEYHRHRVADTNKIEQVVESKQQQLGEMSGNWRYLIERLVLRKDLNTLERCCKKRQDSLLVLDFAHKQAQPELKFLFSKLNGNDVYAGVGFGAILEQISEKLDGLLRYHQLSTKITLEANRDIYHKSGFVKAIKKFRENVLPEALKSSIPIASGLITYQQLAGSVDLHQGVLPMALGLLASASVAAVVGLGIALRQSKAGESLEKNIRTAIRGTCKTLTIGAGVQAVILGEAFLQHFGMTFDVGWKQVLLYAALGGMLNATIGYFTDVAELVGDKLDKFYQPKVSKYYQLHPEVKKDSVASELLQFRWLVNDLKSSEDRPKLVSYLKAEGVNTAGLTKSILFDLTVGAMFGLIGARASFIAHQSKDVMRTAIVQSATKFLNWTEKVLSRNVRASLISAKQSPAIKGRVVEQLQHAVKELVEAVSE